VHKKHGFIFYISQKIVDFIPIFHSPPSPEKFRNSNPPPPKKKKILTIRLFLELCWKSRKQEVSLHFNFTYFFSSKNYSSVEAKFSIKPLNFLSQGAKFHKILTLEATFRFNII